MSQIEQFISPLVQSQFPAFFQDEGPLFILFAEEYYRWLETQTAEVAGINVAGKTGYYSRTLLDNRDIDKTLDEFIVYFKEKYLKNVQFSSLSNKKLLIKAAQDLYKSKGSEKSVDLLFRLLYGTSAEVYLPSKDIFKPSQGEWVLPRYIEVTKSTRNPSLVNKEIVGTKSGARAFVEELITRQVKGKSIDVLYLSNIRGNFIRGELVTNDGIILDAPKIIGSLNSLTITSGGQSFEVGEVVNIISESGIRGKALVTETGTDTGLVNFEIVDLTYSGSAFLGPTPAPRTQIAFNGGSNLWTDPSTNVTYRLVPHVFTINIFGTSIQLTGWILVSTIEPSTVTNYGAGFGYSNTANVLISQKMLAVQKYDVASPNTILLFETVSQNLLSIPVTSITGRLSNGSIIYDADSSGQASLVVVQQNENSNTANVTINRPPFSGDIVATNNYFYDASLKILSVNTSTLQTGMVLQQSNATYGNAYNTATILSVANSVVLALNVSTIAGSFAPGQFIRQGSTANGVVVGVPWRSNFNQANASYLMLSNVQGTFTTASIISAYPNSANTTTFLGNSQVTSVNTTSLITIQSSNTTPWYEGNTVVNISNTNLRGTIIGVANVGGLFTIASNVNVTASGTLIGSNVVFANSTSNTGYIGVIDVINTFFAGNNCYLNGVETANTTYKLTSISTGSGANAKIGTIENSETVIVSEERLSANNDGPSSYTIPYTSLKLTGVNSGYNYILDTYVANGGTGYTNSYTTTTGGSPSLAANLQIYTDNTGVIVAVYPANTGNGYSSLPSITLSGGSGANVIPLFPYGFVKDVSGTLNTTLNNLLGTRLLTIGSIGSLTNINPGENYNVDPFVLPVERIVSDYDKKDFKIEYFNSSGLFTKGELITQSQVKLYRTLIANTISGNSQINTVTITNGGYGYTNGQPIYTNHEYLGAGGAFAFLLIPQTGPVQSANIVINTNTNGTITSFTYANNGTGVTNAASLQVKGNSADVGKVRAVVINNAGYGYTNGTSITFTGGGASTNAVATITTNANGAITNVVFTNTGIGYTSAPGVGVTGGTGQSLTSYIDAILTANITPVLPRPGDRYFLSSNTNNFGFVYSSEYNSTTNSYSIVLENTSGNNFTGDFYSRAAKQTINVASTNSTSNTLIYKGYVKGADTLPESDSHPYGWVLIRRLSMFGEFKDDGSPIVGTTSGTVANTSSVRPEEGALPIGRNAMITANVVAASGSLVSADVIDSGLGYIQDETVSMTNRLGYVGTAKATVSRQGVAEGRYASTDGFLSDTKKIFDGDYYQEYSYEVQSAIPLETYANVLKEVLHVAGTKYFGRVVKTETVGLVSNVVGTSNTITIS